jgi:hypothetical protein
VLAVRFIRGRWRDRRRTLCAWSRLGLLHGGPAAVTTATAVLHHLRVDGLELGSLEIFGPEERYKVSKEIMLERHPWRRARGRER